MSIESEMFEAAYAAAPRKGDHQGVDLDAVIEDLAERLPFDLDRAKRQHARAIVNARTKRNATIPDGQLSFEGMEPYPWEPDRLIKGDDDTIVKQKESRPAHKSAEFVRYSAKLLVSQRHLNELATENKGFQDWSLQKALEGWAKDDITMDKYVHDADIWSPKEPEPSADTDDDEDES